MQTINQNESKTGANTLKQSKRRAKILIAIVSVCASFGLLLFLQFVFARSPNIGHSRMLAAGAFGIAKHKALSLKIGKEENVQLKPGNVERFMVTERSHDKIMLTEIFDQHFANGPNPHDLSLDVFMLEITPDYMKTKENKLSATQRRLTFKGPKDTQPNLPFVNFANFGADGSLEERKHKRKGMIWGSKNPLLKYRILCNFVSNTGHQIVIGKKELKGDKHHFFVFDQSTRTAYYYEDPELTNEGVYVTTNDPMVISDPDNVVKGGECDDQTFKCAGALMCQRPIGFGKINAERRICVQLPPQNSVGFGHLCDFDAHCNGELVCRAGDQNRYICQTKPPEPKKVDTPKPKEKPDGKKKEPEPQKRRKRSAANQSRPFQTMVLSLIDWIDGSESCDKNSNLGYWGLILWTIIIIYLFIGLYVLCEVYFVPILQAIAKRLNMSDDVAGATLMAAGSSAPELFTALIGVLFYANENPGPSTNCASAAFNMCVIIGCSIFFSGYSALPIRGYPFIRDCLFYAIAVIELYLFWEVISPGVIEWGESLSLVLSWCGYITVLIYNNKVIKLCVSLMSWMGMSNAEEMLYEQLKQNSSLNISDSENEPLSKHECVDISEYEKIQTTKGHIQQQQQQQKEQSEEDDDIMSHSRHFIAMELEERDAENLKNDIHLKQHSNLPRVLRKAPKIKQKPIKQHVKSPSPQRHKHKQQQVNNAGSNILTHEHMHMDNAKSVCGKYWEKVIFPFHFAFKYTIPRTNNESTTLRLSIGFFLVLVWLGILTFICVDSAEKMGNCLRISEDVMGLTLLAIGSSLPDCFSSVLAAKQGKGEMAVSNALGSNVFDINICIGCSFLLKSIVSGFKQIQVEHDQGFELFIAALFVLLALFMVAMFCYGLVLNKTIGAGLMAAYAVFLGAFAYLLQYD